MKKRESSYIIDGKLINTVEEKGTTEDEMAGWHHRLNRHEVG